MTKIIQASKNGIVAVLVFLSIGMVEAKMNTSNLWSFINSIRESVKNVTVNNFDRFPLPVIFSYENEYVKFYKNNENTVLTDSTIISDVDLRLSKDNDGMAPFLTFTYSGKCVSLNDIKREYRGVFLTDYPRGRSENEMTSYTTPADVNGQTLTFGFTVKEPDCLHQVTIAAE